MAITRLWQAGFEENSVEVFTNWQQYVGISSTYAKTGTYAVPINRANTANRYATRNFTATDRVRVGLWMYAPVDSCGTYWAWYIATAGDGNVAGMVISGATSLAYNYVLGASQGYDTYLQNSWIHWGIDLKVDPTNGWSYLYKDGEQFLTFDGNTGSSNVAMLVLGNPAGGTSGAPSIWFDDIYIDDTTGEASPAPLPLIRFSPLTLDGNGNYAQWDGSDGNSTDNYQLVDEVGPSDADYVETNVADEYDSYTMTGITLDTGQTINAVIPVARAARAGNTEQIALGTRLTSTDSIGSDQNPPTSFGYLSERQTTKPGGGSWGESDVNGAELVIKSRGTY